MVSPYETQVFGGRIERMTWTWPTTPWSPWNANFATISNSTNESGTPIDQRQAGPSRNGWI